MSTRRTKPGGWVNAARLPKGPNGRALCRQCGAEVPVGRRTFCGVKCVHEHLLRTSPQYLREQVFKRDHGVCAQCGLDTLAQVKRPSWRRGRGTGHLWQADHVVPVAEGGGECGLDNIQTLCTACHQIKTAEQARRRAQERKEQQDVRTTE